MIKNTSNVFFLNTIVMFTAERNSKTAFFKESAQKHSPLASKNKKPHPFLLVEKRTISTNQKMIWQHVVFGCLRRGGCFCSNGGERAKERERESFEM